jgi:hypothetical protein
VAGAAGGAESADRAPTAASAGKTSRARIRRSFIASHIVIRESDRDY